MISTKLGLTTKRIEGLEDTALAVSFTLQTDLFVVINAYLPPATKKQSVRELWARLQEYVINLMTKYPLAHIILAGDLNARTGVNDEALYERFQLVPPTVELPPSFPCRQSKDKGCNFAGLCLLQMTHALDLIVLNGGVVGDLHGEYTYVTCHGTSTIDYFMVSPNLLQHVVRCNTDIRDESDHLPLTLTLNLGYEKLLLACEPLHNLAAERRVARIRWTPTIANKISKFLYSADILSLRDRFSSQTAPESICILFQDLLRSINNSPNFKKEIRSCAIGSVSKPWFDQDCVLLKNTLMDIYRRYRTSELPALPAEYLDIKRRYKILIKQKKKLHQRETWQRLIDASRLKDSGRFWRLVSRGWQSVPPCIEYHIPASKWESYFAGIFAKSYNTNSLLWDDFNNLPSWPPVSICEITALINKLKTGKVPCVDNIPPEFLKEHLDWWAPILAALFTAIDQSICIPDDWQMAIVVPIYKKGKRADPSNYRPISLLSVISRLYTSHLLEKLSSWLDDENLLADEQAGFRSGRSTVDQGLVLQHLVEKYSSPKGGALFTAFIDLKSAFDLVSRERLWEKLKDTNMDRCLLCLIHCLYEKT
ncbi:uncharacterized protein LOC133380093 [Rhineura floridana]|uniref:uncharacterized protein LOC133380093 n=1 Tax=Rhineura floridana TaxID=261503 RepID=UPI002AC837DB|nr:uncharacterized protein LOC133380093 [Rhineura floridana]